MVLNKFQNANEVFGHYSVENKEFGSIFISTEYIFAFDWKILTHMWSGYTNGEHVEGVSTFDKMDFRDPL